MEIEVLENPAARVVEILLDAAQAGGQIPNPEYHALARAT